MDRNEVTMLADKARAGDRSAFEKLYDEFSMKVFYFIRQNVGADDAAEDITSETFTAAIENIHTLRKGESFVGWLYSIAYKKCADHIKNISRRESLDEEQLEGSKLNEPILLPDDYAVNRETKAQLKEIIDSLPADMRAAVIMYYYDEMTIPEVSAALETNDNNTRQKLFQARKKIKAKVEKLIGKDGLFAAVPMSAVLENLSDGVWIAAGAALAVGVTAGLNKASGGIGDVLLYITRKYWAKHKKSLAALLFSGVLLCAVVCCAFLLQRAEFRRYLDDTYYSTGYYSFMWLSDDTDILNALRTDETIEGTINILGKTGKGAIQYEYGTLDDPYDLAHIPFESGRLPEKEGEIAIERHALDKLGFFGSVGDKITLDSGTYTLVGIIDKETYGHSREFSRSADEWINDTNTYKQSYDESDVKYIPMIYVCGDNSQTPLYSYTMLDNIKEFQNADELDRYFVSNLGYTDGMLPSVTWKNKTVDAADSYKGDFAGKERSTTILCIIATLISSLSVIAVMRNIFSEREASISMLKKIGMSKRSIRVMLLIEYIILSFVQSAIGLALGASVYYGIYRFQVGVLEQPPLSGFTDDKLITENIASPYLLAIAFSLAVLLSGYLFAAMLSHIKMPNVRKRKAAGLSRCIARAFANRSVTVIQTLALTLICFGTVFGYMLYYTTTGFFDNETGEFHPYVTTKFGSNNRFDFEEDGIEEYYAAYPVQNNEIESLRMSPQTMSTCGIDDTTADRLDGVIATGRLTHTFLQYDEKQTGLAFNITFGDDEMRKFIYDSSSDEGKELIDSGKYFYGYKTAIANKAAIEQLEPYVISGSIDIDKLSSGEQMIAVMTEDMEVFESGDKITLGSLYTENGFGIDKLSAHSTEIGAVVRLNKDTPNVLQYAVTTSERCGLLTTAQGAKNLGISNASYTEVFAKKALSSDALPLGTGLQKTSYSAEKHKLFLQNATQIGSMALLISVMSLLGFAAYFNGIGMKIRLKEYQISVMRAVGTPLKKLRRRLMLDSIRIPVAASVFTFGGIKLMQKIMKNAYNDQRSLWQESRDMAEKYRPFFQVESMFNEFVQKMNEYNERMSRIGVDYLLGNQMWFIRFVIPLAIVFGVMCIITIFLTRKSCKMFTPDIASSLAKGRKRQ